MEEFRSNPNSENNPDEFAQNWTNATRRSDVRNLPNAESEENTRYPTEQRTDLGELLRRLNQLQEEVMYEREQAQRNQEELHQLRNAAAENNARGAPADLSEVFQNFATTLETAITSRNMRFEDVEKSFKTFFGDGRMNVSSWITHFKNQADLLSLSHFQRFAYAKRLMRGTAQLFVRYESKANTWLELENELSCEFGQKLNSAIVHRHLRERKKKREETCIQYMYEMIAIAAQADVDHPAVISYIVDGLPGSPESKAFMYDAENIKVLKKKLQSYELLQSKLAVPDTREKRPDNTKGIETKQQGRALKCSACGQLGHIQLSCPNAGTTTKTINILRRAENDNQPTPSDEEEDDEFRLSPEETEKMYRKMYYRYKSAK